MCLCPLCNSTKISPYAEDKRRPYLQCHRCKLVFVPEGYHLTPEAEKAEYDKHQNSEKDAGYRKFLSRLVTPLTQHVNKGDCGLDFGCGPGPAVSAMFAQAGCGVVDYDPFYFPHRAALERVYDFVTATEVVEHFRQPASTLSRIWTLVKPGGYFGVMTKLVRDPQAFGRWHYKNDPTHICFYSLETLRWLENHWQAELLIFDRDAFAFKKNAEP